MAQHASGAGTLSAYQAFRAMGLFLRQFADRAGDDLGTLLADTTISSDGMPIDPAAWDDWIACVRSVMEGSGTAADRSPAE